MEYAFLAVGLLAGGLIAWLLLKSKLALAEGKGRAAGEVDRTSLSEQLKAAGQDLASTKSRLADAEGRAQQLQTGTADLREQSGRLTAEVAAKEKRLGELEMARAHVA